MLQNKLCKNLEYTKNSNVLDAKNKLQIFNFLSVINNDKYSLDVRVDSSSKLFLLKIGLCYSLELLAQVNQLQMVITNTQANDDSKIVYHNTINLMPKGSLHHFILTKLDESYGFNVTLDNSTLINNFGKIHGYILYFICE